MPFMEMFRIKIAMHRTFFKHYESLKYFLLHHKLKKIQYHNYIHKGKIFELSQRISHYFYIFPQKILITITEKKSQFP